MAENRPNLTMVGGGVLLALLLVATIYLFSSNSRLDATFAREIETLEAERDRIQAQFDEQVTASGTRDALQSEIAALEPEAEALRAERDNAQADLDALTGERTALEYEAASLSTAAEQSRGELAALEDQVSPLRQEIAQFEERRGALADEIVTQTDELAAVGERLEEARSQETELSQSVAQLSDDRARLAEDAEEAEARLQASLEDEAFAREETEKLRAEVSSLEEERTELENRVAELTERRSLIEKELAAAEEQRGDVQNILTQLTDEVESRAARLSNIERSLSNGLSSMSGSASKFETGGYMFGDIPVTFDDDGKFSIMGGDEEGATGVFRIEDGALVLISNDARELQCDFELIDGGFKLSGSSGACEDLGAEEFQRQE